MSGRWPRLVRDFVKPEPRVPQARRRQLVRRTISRMRDTAVGATLDALRTPSGRFSLQDAGFAEYLNKRKSKYE